MNSQTLKSHYDRPPLTIGADIPTSMLWFHLGRVHVSTPSLEVALDVWEAMKRSPVSYNRRQRKETLAAALWIHAEGQAEYQCVMGGRL